MPKAPFTVLYKWVQVNVQKWIIRYIRCFTLNHCAIQLVQVVANNQMRYYILWFNQEVTLNTWELVNYFIWPYIYFIINYGFLFDCSLWSIFNKILLLLKKNKLKCKTLIFWWHNLIFNSTTIASLCYGFKAIWLYFYLIFRKQV